MADVIGEAAYRIKADTSGFEEQARGGITSAARKLAVSFAAAFAVKKVFDFGRQAIDEAALTQKAQENIRAQLGKSADVVFKFSEGAAKSFGVSNAVASQFASQVSLIGRNMGLSQASTATMAVDLGRLGGVMSEIKGVAPEEVFTALETSLQGSTRGLRSLGITLNTSQVQNEAFRLGLIKTTTTALTPAARAQATFSLLMRRYPALAREAARGSGDWANVSARLHAEFDNLKEDIGRWLLPYIEQVGIFIEQKVIPRVEDWVKVIQDRLGPAISTAGGFLQKHAALIEQVASAFLQVSAATIGLGTAVEASMTAFELLTNPLSLVLAIGTGLVLAYQNFGAFRDAVRGGARVLEGAFGPVVRGVHDAIGAMEDAFGKMSSRRSFTTNVKILWRGIEQAAGDLWNSILRVWNGTGGALQRKPLLVGGKDIQFDQSSTFKPGVKIQLQRATKSWWDNIDWGSVFLWHPLDFVSAMKSLWGLLNDIRLPRPTTISIKLGQWLWDGLNQIRLPRATTLTADLGRWLQGVVTDALGSVSWDWGNAVQGLTNVPTDLFGAIVTAWNDTVGKLHWNWGDALQGLENVPADLFAPITAAWDATVGKIDFPSIGELLRGAFGGGGAQGGGSVLSIDLGAFLRFDWGGIMRSIRDEFGSIDWGSLISGPIGRAWDDVTGSIGRLDRRIRNINWPGGGVLDALRRAWDDVSGAVGRLVRRIGGINWPGGGVLDALQRAWDDVTQAVGRLIRRIGSINWPGGGVLDALRGAWDDVTRAVGGLIRRIGGIHWPGGGVLSGIIGAWNTLSGWVRTVITDISNIHWPSPPSWVTSGIGFVKRHTASGSTFFPGGMTWVGEHGPELMSLPRGTRVWNASESAAMAKGSMGGGNTIVHVHLDDPSLRGLIRVEIAHDQSDLAAALAAGTVQ